ncbi:MAG: cyclic nucleotide-binding/CBS domain-containing protein [Acidimicrobiia bacterium]
MDMSELVAGAIVSAPPGMKLVDVAKLMEAEGVGSVAVLDSNEDFIGIVTDRDIVHAVARSEEHATAGEIMTEAPDTIEIDTEISDAVAWMNATGYRHLPITENGKLVGMVSIKDLLWAVAGS